MRYAEKVQNEDAEHAGGVWLDNVRLLATKSSSLPGRVKKGVLPRHVGLVSFGKKEKQI